MQKLIFFVGMAGTGKTTVAKEVSKYITNTFIDRDTVGNRFVEKILEMNGYDKNDRDSEFYKKNIRDIEYEAVKDICVENISINQNVFMISPFTQELMDKNWIEELLAKAKKKKEEVDVKVVVVSLNNNEKQRERIKKRETTRDNWKLKNWEQYKERINFNPTINWDIPKKNIIKFDNSGKLTDEKIQRLVSSIMEG